MKKMLAIALMAGLVIFQGTAFAKLVSGNVAGVDSTANTLSIDQTDPATGSEEKVTVAIQPSTSFSGVASLAELSEGQEVLVDASEDAASGSWNAVSVKAGPAAPAAPAVQ